MNSGYFYELKKILIPSLAEMLKRNCFENPSNSREFNTQERYTNPQIQ